MKKATILLIVATVSLLSLTGVILFAKTINPDKSIWIFLSLFYIALGLGWYVWFMTKKEYLKRKTLGKKRQWYYQEFLNLLIIGLLLLTGCQSQSGKTIENRVTERCIVIDSQTIKLVDSDAKRTYLKVRRLSDGTIHSEVTYLNNLYDVGDTILVHFDKRFDYQTQ